MMKNLRRVVFSNNFIGAEFSIELNSLCLRLFLLLTILISGATVNAQLSGTKNIPGDYPTLNDAINALNTQGVGAGGVTLNLLAGNPETAPAGGYVIGGTGSLVLTSSSSTNTILIQGNGNTITAPTPQTSGNLNDAIFKIIGADWVTLTGFTMNENVANTTTAAGTNNMTEWGVALLYVTTTDGAQNNTIQNNTITLNRTYQNTFGIYSNSTHSASAVSTSATATTVNGANSNLKIYTNNISNVNLGIVVVGPTGVAEPNLGIDIGGSSLAQGNTLTNFGTTGTFSSYINVSGTVNGILVRNSNGFNISYNSISSSAGGVSAGTLNGIQIPAASTAPTTTFTNAITNNTISLQSGVAAGAINGITYPSGSASTTSAVNISNNNFTNLSHTVTASGTIIAISCVSTNLTTTINNNTFTNITCNTTGSFTFIAHSFTIPANGSKSVTNNSIVTGFNKTGAGGTVTCMTTGSSSPNTAVCQYAANNFSNITVNGATAITGISDNDGSGSSPTKNYIGNTLSNWTGGSSSITAITVGYVGGTSSISNNTISNISGQGAITGLNIGSSANLANPLTVASNSINNLISSGTGGSVSGLTCSNTSVTVNINDNTIHTLSSTGSTSTINGLNITGAATTNLFKNKIYNLSGNQAGSIVNGINATSGTTLNIYNNLIGNLTASAATGLNAINGINASSTTNFNIYYNSIYINATSSSATTFGSSCITFSSTATALILRNNILVNTSTPAQEGSNSDVNGISACLRRSAGTTGTVPANFSTLSNNNAYWVNPSAGTNNHLTYVEGTSTITNPKNTLTQAKSFFSNREQSSIQENPTWQSTDGSSSDFLKFSTSIASQLESGAVNISTFTDDFAGTIRQGNPGYAGTSVIGPDMGAWELEGIPLDLVGPSITYALLGNSSCITEKNLSPVTISDGSGVNITAGTRPRLYFKKSINANTYADNTNATDGWKYVEATGSGSSPFSFTTDFSLLFGGSGAATGDVIQYFVVAQDNAAIPNVGLNSGTFNSTPGSVALTAAHFPIGGSINSFSFILPGLSGTKTVGAAGDYTSLTGTGGLFEAINNLGLSASLTVNIIDASITEAGTVALNNINYNGCVSGPYNLTIKPNATSTLTGSVSSGALIKLNGADYVTIDGSSSGGTDRSLTITNTATTAPTGISIVSLGTGLGGTNNTIKNCIISTGVASTIGYGISVGGNTPGTGGDDNDNTTLQNNSITEAPIGIFAAGNSTGSDDNLNIIGNSIVYNGALASIGIQSGFANNSLISQNTVDEQTSTSQAPTGISLETSFINSSVTRNNITRVLTSNTGGYGGRGITVGTGTATSNLTIANNFISGINGSNWTGFSNSSSMGIGIGMIGNSSTINTTAGGIKIYNNSVNLYGSYQGTSTTTNKITAALYVGTGASALDVRNNVFVNTMNNPNAVATAYAIYCAAASSAFTNIDYNDYFVSGAQGVLGFIGSNRSDLAGIIAGFGQNSSSTNSDPKFMSNSDLHINTSLATIVEGKGTPLASVTTDIDNDTRNALTPDLGADEGNFMALIANDVQATAFIDPINGGTKGVNVSFTPMASFTNNGTNNQTNVPIRYRIVNASMVEIYNETGIITTLNSGSSFTHTFPSVTITAAGSYTIYAKAELVGDELASNDQINGTISIENPLCGTYAVGSSQPSGFQNLTQAINKLNAVGVSCAVIYELQADYSSAGETFPLTINPIAGISATNTFTLRPDAGVTNTISGSAASNALIKILSDYVIIDGSNNGSTSRDLSITNTNTTSPTVVLIGSTGTTPRLNVTLKNCNLTNGSTSASAVVISDATVSGNDGYFNNITVQNNQVKKAFNGIYARAAVAAGNGSGLSITNNDLTSSGADAISFIGIYLQGIDGGMVSGNLLGNFNATSSEDDKGIWLATGVKNTSVITNKISNIGYTGTSGYGGHGIYLSTGVTAANVLVANNMIANLNGDGWSYTSVPTDNPIGIALSGTQTGVNVYHNSISLSGNTLNQTDAMSMGLYLGAGSEADIRNNIIVNNLGRLSSIGYGAAGVYAVTSNTQFTDINYNNYIVAPTGTGNKFTGQIASVGSTDLAAWQTATGKDANSVSILPVFTSATDLHLIPASNLTLDNLGTPLASVTVDIDNDIRSLTTPDLGCDEFSLGCSGQPNAGSVTPVNASLCLGATYMMTATGLSSGTGFSYQWKSGPSGGPYTSVSGGTGATTSSYTTPSLETGNYYYVLETLCSNSGQTNITNEVAVGVTGDEVTNENNAGTGSLRKAIECTAAGDTVFVSSGSVNLINLLSQLNIDKPLLILDDNGSPVMLKFDFSSGALMSETNGGFKVGTMGNVTLDNIHVKHVANDATHPVIKNEGTLTLKNCKVTGETGNTIPPVVQNAAGATINAEGSSEIKSE